MVCYQFFSFQCTIPLSAKSVLYLKKFKVLLLLFLRWDVIQAWRKRKLNNIFYMAVGVCDAPDTLLRFVPPSRHRFKKIGTCAHVVAKCLVWYVTELPFCNQCPSVIFAKQQLRHAFMLRVILICAFLTRFFRRLPDLLQFVP